MARAVADPGPNGGKGRPTALLVPAGGRSVKAGLQRGLPAR